MIENLLERVLPMAEDPLNIPADNTRGHPRGPRQVLDFVDHTRPATGRLEAVFVAPPQVRTCNLTIDEPAARFPHVDPRRPCERHTMKPDAVVDLEPGTHHDGQRRHK